MIELKAEFPLNFFCNSSIWNMYFFYSPPPEMFPLKVSSQTGEDSLMQSACENNQTTYKRGTVHYCDSSLSFNNNKE